VSQVRVPFSKLCSLENLAVERQQPWHKSNHIYENVALKSLRHRKPLQF
jgi:hypothetical protein